MKKVFVYVVIDCHGAGDGPFNRSIKRMQKFCGFEWQENWKGAKHYRPNDLERVVRGQVDENKIEELWRCIDVIDISRNRRTR